MTEHERLIEEAKAWRINPANDSGIPHWVSLNKGSRNLPFAFIHEDEAEMIIQLATALAAALTREKEWADNVLIATGGHAKTPAEARRFIGDVRDMLDFAKGETKAAERENARLREALEKIISEYKPDEWPISDDSYSNLFHIAVAAIAGPGEGK